MKDNLIKAREKLKAMAEAGVKRERSTFKEKLLKNPKSMALAVKAKCWECAGNGDDGIGETKKTIRECVVDCPLHNFRPYK